MLLGRSMQPSIPGLATDFGVTFRAHFNTGPGSKAFLLTYTQLALTVAYELGLNKSPSEEQSFTSCFKAWGPPKGGIGVGFGRPPVKPRTMEERRTILALWFMTSMSVLILYPWQRASLR